jgi:hypothetical protein
MKYKILKKVMVNATNAGGGGGNKANDVPFTTPPVNHNDHIILSISQS